MYVLLDRSERMKYHTDLAVVFEALGGRQKEYNWLITDLECNHYPPEFPPGEPKWLTGEELTDLVTRHDIQFVWAVLSGFRPGVLLDLDHLAKYPYADGNPGFWEKAVQIQHPLATVEIVCWDATSTLLLSKDEDLTARFCHFFPDAEDLEAHNRQVLQRHVHYHWPEPEYRWPHPLVTEQNFEEALRDCNEAINRAPNWVTGYLYRATVYAQAAHYDLALLDCNQAVALNPELAEVYYVRATIHKRAGNLAEAASDLRRVMEAPGAEAELRQEAADELGELPD